MQDLEQFLAFARRSRAIDDRSDTVDGYPLSLAGQGPWSRTDVELEAKDLKASPAGTLPGPRNCSTTLALRFTSAATSGRRECGVLSPLLQP